MSNLNNKAAFKLLKSLSPTPENVVLSPVSINTALAMLIPACTEGTTTQELLSFYHPDVDQDTVVNTISQLFHHVDQGEQGIVFNTANAFLSNIVANPSYVELLKNTFDAEVGVLQSVDQVNQWCAEKTENEIKEIIQDLTDVVAILLNAIYFKGSWVEEFDVAHTVQRNFANSVGETKQVDMMFRRNQSIEYGEIDGVQVCKLPYGTSSDFYAVVLLPNDLNELIHALDTNESLWEQILDATCKMKMVLGLPRFELEYGVDLVETLKSHGVNNVFKEGSLLRAFNPSIYVSKIIHKAVVKVDEKGTTAAAVTAVTMKRKARASPTPTMVCDSPFLFNICYQDQVLFACAVKDIASQ
eukprot:TRINITY_DN515_c0_g1_i3.p1 TRINITY_DN515_c0_g1~~TRINITY_DN515_c0_g1_i3.p1  ORF type:complete len:369 (-),score=62.31 TRINITY_DN515_c0_g1_i3:41-1111(-)